MNEYEQIAEQFLKDTQTEMKAEFLKYDFHFEKDIAKRDIYKITFKRGNRVWSFNFGQSLMNSTRYQDRITKDIIFSDGSFAGKTKKIYPESFNGFVKDYCKKIEGSAPTAYDVLAGLTKYDVGSFENFCSDFGYDEDSRTAEKIYKAVCDEWLNVQRMWTDKEIEALREIN